METSGYDYGDGPAVKGLLIAQLREDIRYLQGRGWLYFAQAAVLVAVAASIFVTDWKWSLVPALIAVGLVSAALSNFSEVANLRFRLNRLTRTHTS